MPLPTEMPAGLLSGGAVFIRLTAETFALVRCTTLTIAVERYRHQHGKESYVVYSVGANRKDDGGSTMRKAEENRPLDCGLRIRLQKPE
jgi:hypothetical protein